MIIKIRIDDRLLHGQIAYSWKAKLNYEAIVIANDNAANDELRKAAIKLCSPAGVKLAVRDIPNAITLLKNEKLKNMKVFVICSNPKDVLRLIRELDERPIVNLGGIQSKENSKFFSNAVYLTKEDLNNLDLISSYGYNIEVQEVPETPMYDYKTLRAKEK